MSGRLIKRAQQKRTVQQALKYDGPTITSRNKASQVITDIKQQRRIAFLVEKAERRGMSAAHIQGIVALIKQHGL
ncbi:hypothetical protein OEZ86_000237 [Tetradesmus obliquus]|nr:hypothetical protein OEZ86_000237 [Tetradesmus obliquus]